MKLFFRISFVIFTLFLFESCVNIKRMNVYNVSANSNKSEYKENKDNFEKETVFYQDTHKENSDGSKIPHYKTIILHKSKKVRIDDSDEEKITFEFIEPLKDEDTTVILNKYKDTHNNKVKSEYYISQPEYENLVELNKCGYYKSSKFKYWGYSHVFQAATVPFKVRLKTGDVDAKISTSGNLGLVYGLKFKINSIKNFYYNKNYSNEKDRLKTKHLKRKKTTFSLTPGTFFGFSTIDLTSSNTNNALSSDKTTLGINYGAILVFGIDKFNIGLAGGWDNAFGYYRKDWIYNNKFWVGFILSLEFIKD